MQILSKTNLKINLFVKKYNLYITKTRQQQQGPFKVHLVKRSMKNQDQNHSNQGDCTYVKLHVNKGGSAKLCNKLSFKQKQTLRTRNNHIPSYSCRADCFKYSIFLPTLNDWFNLNEIITNSESILIFKSKLLYFICQVQSNIYIQYFSPKRAQISNSFTVAPQSSN